jgi:hypothetical protein
MLTGKFRETSVFVREDSEGKAIRGKAVGNRTLTTEE